MNCSNLLVVGAADVRAHLAAIQGYTRLMLTERVGPLSDLQRRCMTGIQSAAQAAQCVAENMEQFQRLERAGIRMANVALGPLIREIGPEIVRPGEHDPVISDVQADPEHDGVMGDRDWLKRALTAVVLSLGPRSAAVSVTDPAGTDRERWITLAPPHEIEEASAISADKLRPFDEIHPALRHLEMLLAERVIAAHGGRVCQLTSPFNGGVIRFSKP